MKNRFFVTRLDRSPGVKNAWKVRLIVGWGGLLCLISCNLEREIEIDLPPYDNRVVVECYLEPGRPYSLLLTRSAAYFDPLPDFGEQFIRNLLVSNAEVTITHRGEIISLRNELFLDRATGKFYNYRSTDTVPADFAAPFELLIRTIDQKTIRATTRLLPVVPIDSVVVEFRDRDTLARVLTYLTDPAGTDNYYRRILHRGSLETEPEQDFSADDRFVEKVLVFGTNFEYAPGDTLISTMCHIDKAYYDFLETLRRSAAANGNPFAQPSPIVSNLEGDAGALGIFTGLTYDRATVIIRR